MKQGSIAGPSPLAAHAKSEDLGTLKADLDGTILAYDYRARLAYVMTFEYLHAHNFHLRHPFTMRPTNVVGLSYTTIVQGCSSEQFG